MNRCVQTVLRMGVIIMRGFYKSLRLLVKEPYEKVRPRRGILLPTFSGAVED